MTGYSLKTVLRGKTGKEAAKKFRAEGSIPAVLYGHKGNKNLTIKASEFETLFEEIGEHSIITLSVGDKEKAEVIVKDFQLDAVKKNIIHVDFFEIEKDKTLRTAVPVKIEGTSFGVKKGGILEVFMRDIEIECLPKDIPDFITVSVENLDIGNNLHVKDIKVAKEIRVISNPEKVVLTIGTPTKVAAPVEAPAAAPAEGEAPEAEAPSE